MGSVEHGLNIIDRFSDIASKYSCFSYAFKLQLRDLDTFIHPNFRGREDLHYVKRFSDTKLEIGDYKKLLDRIRTNGHKTMITPFDEKSVDEIEKLDVDILVTGHTHQVCK